MLKVTDYTDNIIKKTKETESDVIIHLDKTFNLKYYDKITDHGAIGHIDFGSNIIFDIAFIDRVIRDKLQIMHDENDITDVVSAMTETKLLNISCNEDKNKYDPVKFVIYLSRDISYLYDVDRINYIILYNIGLGIEMITMNNCLCECEYCKEGCNCKGYLTELSARTRGMANEFAINYMIRKLKIKDRDPRQMVYEYLTPDYERDFVRYLLNNHLEYIINDESDVEKAKDTAEFNDKSSGAYMSREMCKLFIEPKKYIKEFDNEFRLSCNEHIISLEVIGSSTIYAYSIDYYANIARTAMMSYVSTPLNRDDIEYHSAINTMMKAMNVDPSQINPDARIAFVDCN